LAEKGVQVILTGRVGPKALAVLDKAGIRVVDDTHGTVEEALAAFLATSHQEKPEPASARQAVPGGSGRQPGDQGRGRAGDLGCRPGCSGRGKGRGAGPREKGGCR